MTQSVKVGIIACSGEEIPAGTISRLAARRVLEVLRPQATVTLCLPLFLAGEEQERRFARQHPTITVDGCEKRCAQRGTEQHSGPVAAALVVSEILGDRLRNCRRAACDYGPADEEAVWITADRIAAEVDALAHAVPVEPPTGKVSCGCACGGPSPSSRLSHGDRSVTVNGLPLIFAHLYERGLRPEGDFAEQLLEITKIYHEIPERETDWYRKALAAGYRDECRRRAGSS